MLVTTSKDRINSRVLARLISNAGFKNLISEGDYRNFGKELKKEVAKGGNLPDKKYPLKDLLNFSYSHLEQEYRHEYIYKTKLLSDYILKHYSLADTIILNEFKIGASIADMVLVNGTNKVFEIKTELDSPERLKTQLSDYFKGFSEVYIVTHCTLASKYEAIVNEKIGIITFNHDYKLSTYREAVADTSQLENRVMMKSLRKAEFLKIITTMNGSLPETTQVALYKECLAIADKFCPILLQKQFHRMLKTRITPVSFLTNTAEIPDYLKFFCYILNLNEKQYLALPARLSCMV
jgi:hypothetical protein